MESEWTDRIYSAAENFFNRDPYLDHETVVTNSLSAALNELVEILKEQEHHRAAKFVSNLIV
jgi:hypothetical protein